MDEASLRHVRTMQIIIAVLVMGIVVFGLVSIVIVKSSGPVGGSGGTGGGGGASSSMTGALLGVLVAVGLVLLIGAYVVAPVVRKSVIAKVWRNAPKEIDPMPRVAPLYTTGTLISGALAESVALFGTVVFLLTGVWWALAAPGLVVLLMIATFPTAERMRGFVRDVTGRNPMAERMPGPGGRTGR